MPNIPWKDPEKSSVRQAKKIDGITHDVHTFFREILEKMPSFEPIFYWEEWSHGIQFMIEDCSYSVESSIFSKEFHKEIKTKVSSSKDTQVHQESMDLQLWMFLAYANHDYHRDMSKKRRRIVWFMIHPIPQDIFVFEEGNMLKFYEKSAEILLWMMIENFWDKKKREGITPIEIATFLKGLIVSINQSTLSLQKIYNGANNL